MVRNNILDPALKWLQEKYFARDIFFASYHLAKQEIRKALIRSVEEMLKSGKQEIPFDPKEIASARKVKSIVETELLKDGILVPQIGGFLIKINKDIHPFKKRLACAHEIGHTFFFNIDVDPPRREFQYQKSSYWVQEEVSLMIAREILLPQFSIAPIIEKEHISPSIDALRYLSALYQVSFNVLRIRLVNDLALWDCIILISRIHDDKVVTNSVDISKGAAYRDFIIPRTIDSNCELSNLHYVISSTFTERRIKDKIDFWKGKHSIETVLLDDDRQAVMSLIRKR